MTYNYIMDLSAEEETINTETNETTTEPSNVDNFVSTLPVMGKGMLGIFIVIMVIWALVALLNKVTGSKN